MFNLSASAGNENRDSPSLTELHHSVQFESTNIARFGQHLPNS